ncbi:hypothetical protein AB0O95_03080 [Rhodoglobus sp. NPDC076762]
MENNFTHPSAAEAADALQELADDRTHLASNIRVPWPLLAGFGALAAWWVATAASTTPGENYEPPITGWLALVGVFVIAHLIRREIGVRFSKMGAGASWSMAGILVTCFALFSVSLGLVSFGLHWAVSLTSVAAFGVTTLLSGVAFRSAIDKLHND